MLLLITTFLARYHPVSQVSGPFIQHAPQLASLPRCHASRGSMLRICRSLSICSYLSINAILTLESKHSQIWSQRDHTGYIRRVNFCRQTRWIFVILVRFYVLGKNSCWVVGLTRRHRLWPPGSLGIRHREGDRMAVRPRRMPEFFGPEKE